MGQLEIFNNPNCDRARAKNPMPAPDKDGFFDLLGVKALAGRRGCKVKKLSELGLQVACDARIVDICGGLRVRKNTGGATLTAIAPGLWDPVSIIAACSKARGLAVCEIDMAVAKPKKEGRLDELRIARIVGADGTLRPYVSKRSRKHYRVPGEPTWDFKLVMWSAESSETREIFRSNSYAWRKAVRTLQDVGLLDVMPGPRGGLVRAVCRWTPLAYLPPVVRTAGPLDDADEHALACMAEGLPVG
jgi:hypothetical protein